MKLNIKKNKNKARGRYSKEQNSHKSMPTNKYYRPINTSQTSIPKKRTSSVKDQSNISATKIINIFLVLIIMIGLFFASTLSTAPAVRVQNSDDTYRDQSEYASFTERYLTESPLSRSKLLFRSEDFEQAMIATYPEIDQLSAIVPLGGRKLNVAMRVSPPIAQVLNGSKRGILSSNGIVILQNDTVGELSAEKLPLLRFSTPQENFSDGVPLLTSTEVELLQLVSSELQTVLLAIGGSGQLVPKEYLFNIAEGQLEVQFVDQPFFVKFSVYADTRLQVGTMIQTIDQLDREGQSANSLSYIDVRVPGKVYIK